MGTLGMHRTVSKAGLEGGAEVSPEHKGVAGPAEPLDCQRNANPRSQTLGFLSLHRCSYLESANHSDPLKAWHSSANQHQQGEVWGDPSFPQVPGPRGAAESASPRLSAPTGFRSLFVLGIVPWGKIHLLWYGPSLPRVGR